jgi:hydrogenase expression/formation protein HypD
MIYIDEFRDHKVVRAIAERIRTIAIRPWSIMEVCGGQTHTIVKSGIEQLLPEGIVLLHGPGCPVCVTPIEMIDKAIAISSHDDAVLASFGDMLRVPGSRKDLLTAKSEGADVRIVYSPLDAVEIARRNPEKRVVFFAVGFETTAPANAMAVFRARQLEIKNFSILCSHVLVPPAIEALLASPSNRIQAFLAAGHVCTVAGYDEYLPIASKYRVPIVVTGFEPVDILQGIYMAVKLLEEGRYEVENQYARSVTREGNVPAQRLLRKVFTVVDRAWRGIGVIPQSGFRLRDEYARFDAEKIFETQDVSARESPLCIAGEILQGWKNPPECGAFGSRCTPEQPLGAPMVSSEGACAAYFRYRGVKNHVEPIQQ